MLVIVPFHSGDAAQAAATLDWCADLAGQQDFTVILAHEPTVDAGDVQRAASRSFRTVEHLHVSTAADNWPIAANCYFACVAYAMRGREPWLWMESDCALTHPHGLPALAADHARCGKPHLGTIIPAFFNKHGVWTEVGQMMAGVAVYHPSLWDHSPLLRYLRQTNAEYAKARAVPKAFDCYLAPEILPDSASTPLIQHMGRSREFRRENGQIVCTYGAESRWSPVLAPETVLVHGCKDGSLIALLRAEMNIPSGKSSAVQPTEIVLPAPVPTPKKEAGGFTWDVDAKLPKEQPPVTPLPRPTQPSPLHPPKPVDPINAYTGQVSVMALADNLNRGNTTFPAGMGNTMSTNATSHVADKEAFATLADARKAVQHWPECKQHVFALQQARGRFRVVCQCGAGSPKLPEGVDWEAAWNAGTEHPTAKTEIKREPAVVSSSITNCGVRGLGATEIPTVEVSTSQTRIEPSTENPNFEAVKRSMATMLNEARFPAKPKAGADPLEIPISQLRYRKDIIARFPEWKDLLPGQLRLRLNQLKKKERAKTLKPVKKALQSGTERLLTAQARTRKLELLALATGKRGAYNALRSEAIRVGIKGARHFKKDELVIAILEHEFEQPYEEFAPA